MRKTIRIAGLAALTAVLSFSVAACGGGSGGPASVPGSTVSGAGSGTAGSGASTAQIAFAASVPGSASTAQEIFTMNLDGSNRTQITHAGLTEFLPHFSPDGTKLLYTKFLVGNSDSDPNLQADVVVYDFATASEKQLTNTRTGFQPVWSPDGKTIAFGTIAGDALWMMNADGTNARIVTRPSGALDDLRWGDYAWSSDGWIYFVVAQNTNGCYKTRVDKVRADGTARTQVTDGGPNCTPTGPKRLTGWDEGAALSRMRE